MNYFDKYREINEAYLTEDFEGARQKLILLLDEFKKDNKQYDAYINHMIRLLGLYPYMDCTTSLFEDRLAYELFKVDTGEDNSKILHIEQSNVLKKLLEGKSIALSAPTSFGKSFIVDALISIKKPNIIMIIVPTIALTDEYRRRLQQKFGKYYNIVTQYNEDINFNEKIIFIFPQERAILYTNIIKTIDLLIIDEFYKVEKTYEESRYEILLKTIIMYIDKAKQKYFLMPNIDGIHDSFISKHVEFISIKFTTVYLKEHALYKQLLKDKSNKINLLMKILNQHKQTLIYVSSHDNIKKLCDNLLQNFSKKYNNYSELFSLWFAKHYDDNFYSKMFQLGFGIHSGKVHRSISQIQVNLFENNFLHTIISTSSLIEGVNTTAENVVIWNKTLNKRHLNPLTYKNLIGRAGRMFKYFIGHIYILDQIKEQKINNIELNISTENISVDGLEPDKYDFLPEITNNNIKNYIKKIQNLITPFKYDKYFKYHNFIKLKINDIYYIIELIQNNIDIYNKVKTLYYNKEIGKNIYFLLNKFNLRKIFNNRDLNFFYAYMNNINQAWDRSIPEILKNINSELKYNKFTLDNYFDFEKFLTYDIAGCFTDLNIIFRALSNEQINLSKQISSFSNAYLPPLVYQLEEYGLPRVISKSIHKNGLINFNDTELDITKIIDILKDKKEEILNLNSLDTFDKFILKYFYSAV